MISICYWNSENWDRVNSGIIVQNTVNKICKPFFFAISCAPYFSGIVSFSSFVGAVVLDMNHYQRLLVRLSKVENPNWNPYWMHIAERDRTDRPTARPSFRFIVHYMQCGTKARSHLRWVSCVFMHCLSAYVCACMNGTHKKRQLPNVFDAKMNYVEYTYINTRINHIPLQYFEFQHFTNALFSLIYPWKIRI